MRQSCAVEEDKKATNSFCGVGGEDVEFSVG